LNNYLNTKVNLESLTVSTHASENNKWVDVGITKDIPLNLLDRFEIQDADKSMLEEEAEEAATMATATNMPILISNAAVTASKTTEVSQSTSAL